VKETVGYVLAYCFVAINALAWLFIIVHNLTN
jgi:hypothetical protein